VGALGHAVVYRGYPLYTIHSTSETPDLR